MGDNPGRAGVAGGGSAANGFCSGRPRRRGPRPVPFRSCSPGPRKGKRVIPSALCVVFILLVPFALAGLSLINTGLGRSRSAAHSMMAALCLTAVAALAYFVCGFAWQGFPGAPSHVLTIAGKDWNWLGAGPFFLRRFELDASPAALAVLLGMFSVSLAALIPLGAGGDRWRLGASCASTVLLAGWTYPLFAHWAWGGGWLAQLGFVDA